jgi:hypothetical protein
LFAYCYRIVVSGRLGVSARTAFDEFEIDIRGSNTALTGELDQSALHGALHRIQSLGLELVEIRRVGPAVDTTGAMR